MAFDESIAIRIRTILKPFDIDIVEKKMFGGLSFMYKGKMSVGIVKDELAVRVIPSKMAQVLANDFVREMDFTKRPMKEFVFVSAPGFETELQLTEWVNLGLEHAESKQ